MAVGATAVVGSYCIVVGGEGAARRPSGFRVQSVAGVVAVGVWVSAAIVAAVGVSDRRPLITGGGGGEK